MAAVGFNPRKNASRVSFVAERRVNAAWVPGCFSSVAPRHGMFGQTPTVR